MVDGAEPEVDGRMTLLRVRVALFLVVLGVFLVNTNQSPLGDSAAAFPIATSVIRDFDLELSEYRDAPGFAEGGWVQETDDGDLLGYFPWAVGLTALPVAAAVDLAGLAGVGDGAQDIVAGMGGGHARLQSVAASLWVSIAVVGAFELARRRMRRRSWAVTAALVFAFGTSAWSTAAFQLWQHGPSLACVVWALVLTDRLTSGLGTARAAAALGVLAAAAFAIRPTNVLLLAGVAVVVAVARRDALGAFAGGAFAVLVPWLVVTRITFGEWLQPYAGADRLGFHDAYLEALVADVVSPGRGLLVFSPIVLVALVGAGRVVRSEDRDPLEVLCLAIVVGHWFVIAGLPHWIGGHSFGPRLFTDVLPCLLVLALPVVTDLPPLRRGVRTPATVAVLALALVSVAIHAQSTLIISTRCWNAFPVDVDDEYGRVWSWRDPMVTTGYRDLLRDPDAALRGRCTRG